MTKFVGGGDAQMRRLVRIGVFGYAVAILAFAPMRDAFGTSSAGAPQPPVAAPAVSPFAPSVGPTAVALGGPGPQLPSLTEAQLAKAVDLATSNAYLTAIVRGATVNVRRVGPWTTFARRGSTPSARLIGASVEVSVSVPVNGGGLLLPRIVYDRTERSSPPYQERLEPYTKTGITEFMVLVDIGRNKVVNITPLPPQAPAD